MPRFQGQNKTTNDTRRPPRRQPPPPRALPRPAPPGEARTRRVAAGMNPSETAFPERRADGAFDLRR